jgi:hypothetical protein
MTISKGDGDAPIRAETEPKGSITQANAGGLFATFAITRGDQ